MKPSSVSMYMSSLYIFSPYSSSIIIAYSAIRPYSLEPNVKTRELLLTILAKLEQLSNASSPMLVTESGITMLLSAVQFLNVKLSMHVTPSGISMLLSDEQSENALQPMLVTESGITMLSRYEQPENA